MPAPNPYLARQLFALEGEIISYQPEPRFVPNRLLEIEGEVASTASTAFPYPFYDIFRGAESLLETGPYEGADPNAARFAYTRKLVRLGQLSMPVGSSEDHGCLRAELLHARSLIWHGGRKKPKSDHLPAAVLFDIEGQPFAYQKSLGVANTAITWRTATYGTQAGAREVPANSLIRLIYDDNESGPAFMHRGVGLIAVRSKVGPSDVEFLRLANQSLPEIVRKGAFDAAIIERPELRGDRAAAERLTGVKIKNLVFDLLKKGKAITVA